MASGGKEITIVEESADVGRDITIFDVWSFRNRLRDLGVRTLVGATVKEITPEGIVVVDEKGEKHIITADTLVISKKLSPNRELWEALQGEVEELYEVGDCVSPRKAINAIHEGFRVVVKI